MKMKSNQIADHNRSAGWRCSAVPWRPASPCSSRSPPLPRPSHSAWCGPATRLRLRPKWTSSANPGPRCSAYPWNPHALKTGKW